MSPSTWSFACGMIFPMAVLPDESMVRRVVEAEFVPCLRVRVESSFLRYQKSPDFEKSFRPDSVELEMFGSIQRSFPRVMPPFLVWFVSETFIGAGAFDVGGGDGGGDQAAMTFWRMRTPKREPRKADVMKIMVNRSLDFITFNN